MHRLIFLFGIFFIIALFSLHAEERGSSAPYISGDSFRVHCKFTYDELSKKINPAKVKPGDTIFVKTDYIGEFFEKIHPNIASRYILVTHNSDHHIPGNYGYMLDDPKLIAWFGMNVDYPFHPKLHPIPIGIANRCWPHGNIGLVKQVQDLKMKPERDMLLYMNFSIGTYFTERSFVYNMFSQEPYCVVSEPKAYEPYLLDLLRVKFVLSPRGNGLDCHRTWEALLMGAIPIVRTSPIDPMYQDMPVIIVNEWSEVTPEFLQEQYTKMQTMKFNHEKSYVKYWLDLIDSYRKAARK